MDLKKGEFPGKLHCLHTAVSVELAIDALKMIAHRTNRDKKLSSNLLRREARSDQPENFDLTKTERLNKTAGIRSMFQN